MFQKSFCKWFLEGIKELQCMSVTLSCGFKPRVPSPLLKFLAENFALELQSTEERKRPRLSNILGKPLGPPHPDFELQFQGNLVL